MVVAVAVAVVVVVVVVAVVVVDLRRKEPPPRLLPFAFAKITIFLKIFCLGCSSFLYVVWSVDPLVRSWKPPWTPILEKNWSQSQSVDPHKAHRGPL